jgi:hypothetical protein
MVCNQNLMFRKTPITFPALKETPQNIEYQRIWKEYTESVFETLSIEYKVK